MNPLKEQMDANRTKSDRFLTAQIEAIAFDLDDTLCDYRKAKEEALTHLANRISTNPEIQETFLNTYRVHEPIIFRAFLSKTITLDEYRHQRFKLPMEASGVHPAPAIIESFNSEYMRRCNEEVQLFPEALSVLNHLKTAGVPLVLITNGPSDGQRTKIKSLGIAHYFRSVCISSETGLAKPDKHAYTSAADALNIKVSNLLMVGDSMHNDYNGALAAGAKALLLDRHGKSPASSGIKRIASLGELL